MFPNSNLHSHTNLSDGANTPGEMAAAAYALGFTSYGFSDHGYAPHDEASMSPENERVYPGTIKALRAEYAGRMEIFLGYEHDMTMPDTDLSPYDYVIGSLHFLRAEGEWRPVDHKPEYLRDICARGFGGDADRMARAYFREIAERLRDYTVLGHIDLITKFNERDPMIDTEGAGYLLAAKDVLRLACERDMLVEINTGAISRGWRTAPYPGEALLRALYDMGGRITITSDCHRSDTIDYAFDTACAYARACGFKETWILGNGGLMPVPLG